MAKGRIRNRMELRAEYDAAEARERADKDSGDEDEVEEGGAEEGEGEAEKTAVKAKKKKAPAKEPRPRKKVQKATRKRVVWVVFDNSNKKIQTFEYTRKQEAEDLATRLTTEKKSTYFVQPVKEDME
jgi:hypothetical protein